MKPQFVTAIYTGLEGTRYNGNTAAIYDRYKLSLRSLADGGYSIVCYTASAHLEDLTKWFENHSNVTLVVEELSENYFHQQIEAIKDRKPKYTTENAWRSRCVEIMWGKFYWLWKNTTELEAGDSLYWIDAGIFHGGLITNKFRSPESKSFYDFDLINQKRNLFEDLNKHAGDKVLNILSQTVNHGSDDYVQVYPARPEYAVIGGIFGGKRDALLDYIGKATTHMQLVIDHDVLLKEEEIMYYLHQREPHLYTNFKFNSWYHDDWPIDLYNPDVHVAFSDFFKVIRA